MDDHETNTRRTEVIGFNGNDHETNTRRTEVIGFNGNDHETNTRRTEVIGFNGNDHETNTRQTKIARFILTHDLAGLACENSRPSSLPAEWRFARHSAGSEEGRLLSQAIAGQDFPLYHPPLPPHPYPLG